MTPPQLPARWRLPRIVLSASLVTILALAAEATGVKTAAPLGPDQYLLIRNLRERIRKLDARVKELQKEVDQLKQDKAKLQAEVAGLRNANAASSPPPAQPRPKREITLTGLAKMNAVQVRASAGCRFSGKMALLGIGVVPTKAGQWEITLVDPGALTPGGTATTRPARGGPIVQATFIFSAPPAFVITGQPAVTISITGDVERVETLPEGAESPTQITLQVMNVQTGP
ncbi:MAG: hypothetical protein MUP47_10820 [Phycisphaerae bacterium]|nr:hypothetical protein [Phycisphaerae bacterium]